LYGKQGGVCLSVMKSMLCLVAVLCTSPAVTQEHTGTIHADSATIARVSGKLMIGNKGFAPIPAFSFNSPLVIGFLSIKKKRFSYEPDFSLGLNGKPWMANNWFRLTFIDSKKVAINAGINPSLFFKTEEYTAGKNTLHALRNLTTELSARYQLCSQGYLQVTYLHIHTFDEGALPGNFFDLVGSYSVAGIAPAISLVLKPEIFYFDFEGNVDGLFSAIHASIEHCTLPFSIYFQGVMPVWTRFTGNSFKWNTGLVFIF